MLQMKTGQLHVSTIIMYQIHLSIIHMSGKVPVDVVADVLVAWIPWRCAGRCSATTKGGGCGDNEVFLGSVVVVVVCGGGV